VDWRFDEPRRIGEVIAATRRLGLTSGLLIANPVPAEAALPADLIEAHIAAACRDAAAAGISGKALTPFLLGRINELTGGASLRANTALIKSNARLAAQIALAMVERNAAEPAFADEL
jgi:pseudouridine-5'-phosphate glycosidase